MARRKFLRRSLSPGTPGSSSTPVFDSTPSKSTPGTTPGLDESEPKTRAAKARTSAVSNKKRPLPQGSDGESTGLDALEHELPRGAKRRVTGSRLVVDIPERVVQPPRRKGVAQAKGKGRAVRDPSDVSDNEEQILDGGSDLEFNESHGDDDSGSEFQESDPSESDYAPSPRLNRSTRSRKFNALSDDEEDEDENNGPLVLDAAMDDAEEEADLEAAVMASIITGSENMKGSTTSSGTANNSARGTAAALRALAAEKRLRQGHVIDDRNASPTVDLSSLASSDEESVPTKSKNKGKSTKSKAAVADTPETRYMTLLEIRRIRREAKHALRVQQMPLRHEEMILRRELGRKLTYAERATVALYLYHPELKTVWGDLEADIPIIEPKRAPQPKQLKAILLPFQQESLHWMKKQETGIWSGGMLADEMGMGKTIQMLALLSSDRQKPNLIVAPTVAIMQWKNEIEEHTTGFKVSVWHGNTREKNVSDLAKFDVVLTTYAVLESSFRKQEKGFVRSGQIMKEKSPLHSVKWTRIILDEAHNIKERSTNTAKGAFELDGKYKWCLSGTPLQNRVGELYSLIRFLGGDPFSYYFCKRCDCKSLHWRFSDKRTCDDCGHTPMMHTCFWNNEILTPIQKHAMSGPGKTAFKKLKILLDRMMLRRTKIERADDLGLPPRTVIVRRDYFSAEEKELYLSLFSTAKRQFSTYVDSGTVLNNYSNIFSLLTRMRQMACHPDLVLKSRRNVDLSGDIVEATVCRICHDVAEDAIKSKCHHIFDRQCIRQYLEASGQDKPACPVCHLPLSIDLEAPAIERDEEAASKARQGILGRLNHETWRSSSKIEALVEELEGLRRRDSTTKSLVFSQFVNFLDLIAWRLQKAGFVLCRLEGSMSPQARDATIKHFMNNIEVTVFLVSLKAGGVALNLTEASRVYLMDSWWNPAVEYQAMDRIHRLGQHRPVHAIKLVVEDSIESRIIQLQEKKSAMVAATLSADDSAMGRLTEEDLGFLFRL